MIYIKHHDNPLLFGFSLQQLGGVWLGLIKSMKLWSLASYKNPKILNKSVNFEWLKNAWLSNESLEEIIA